jgi:hypothetical protein
MGIRLSVTRVWDCRDGDVERVDTCTDVSDQNAGSPNVFGRDGC